MNILSRRDFLKTIAFTASALASPVNISTADAGSRHPNIIYILADDLGYGDLNCLNPESKIQTPNMDRLAENGVSFTDAHSNSGVCTPTRYGVLTGRYCWRSRLKSGVLWGGDEALMDRERLTVASLLKRHGYATSCFGKWHLGMDWARLPKEQAAAEGVRKTRDIDFTKPFRGGPVDLGFDTFYGIHASLDMPPYHWLKDDMSQGIPQEITKEGGREGRTAEGFRAVDVMPELTEAVTSYIHRHAREQGDQPFFLYFPLTAPHTPIVPNDQFIGKSQAGKYGDFVVECDWTVGQVMNAVEQAGIADDTLIILTSDNGPERIMQKRKEEYNHYSAYHFRGCKRDNWDGGHRIPFIASWPGRISAGTTSDEIICLTDLMATCAAIVEEELPDNAGEDSYNILPAMLGEELDEPIREATVHHSSKGLFAIRQGRWKLLLHKGSGGNKYTLTDESDTQLYDIGNDPSDTNNVYKEHPEVVEHLTKLLAKYVKNGRSTPGVPQKNDGGNSWKQLDWIP
ncbi:arylsulfatase [Candidatus Poribacteria bacterium]